MKWIERGALVLVGALIGGVVVLGTVWTQEDIAYPHDLHHQLNTPPVSCDLLKTPQVGKGIWVEAVPAGVRLVSYNAAAHMVSASLVAAPDHRAAYDTWELECP